MKHSRWSISTALLRNKTFENNCNKKQEKKQEKQMKYSTAHHLLSTRVFTEDLTYLNTGTIPKHFDQSRKGF